MPRGRDAASREAVQFRFAPLLAHGGRRTNEEVLASSDVLFHGRAEEFLASTLPRRRCGGASVAELPGAAPPHRPPPQGCSSGGTSLPGGYEWARFEHFALTVGYVLFFLMHITQVIRAGWGNFAAMVCGYELTHDSTPES